jgi:hypothetical protein
MNTPFENKLLDDALSHLSILYTLTEDFEDKELIQSAISALIILEYIRVAEEKGEISTDEFAATLENARKCVENLNEIQ